MVELEIENTTVEQVATAAAHADPGNGAVLQSALVGCGARGDTGSPASPGQREAIAALRERWPDARVEETGPRR